ncbi:MAG TPA: redoxin domain-containing protein [Candidatus Sulfotelmatobacter sp.]|nr:redoxin domain-containing protein [Candidatus Sulfotelmatobacter sp.]
MNRFAALPLLFCLLATPAAAALKAGDPAPDFTAEAAIGGHEFSFSLAEALKKGPVVLYFFPRAFTSGCTAEAHEFAEAAAEFSAAGATLIGMSSDNIGTLHQFSAQECSAKFPVAADPDLTVIRAYDSVMARIPGIGGVASRVSYVIAPDGKVAYVYQNNSPDKHVENTLAAVRKLQGK